MATSYPNGLWAALESGFTVKGFALPSESNPELRSLAISLAGYSDVFMERVWGPLSVDDPDKKLADHLRTVENWTSAGDLLLSDTGFDAAALCGAHGLYCLNDVVALIESGERGLPLVEAWNRMVVANLDADLYWLQATYYSGSVARSQLASKAARYMHAGSPKGVAKQHVFEEWQSWQSGKTKHTSAADFAKAMLNLYKDLDSQIVIERWVRMWRRSICE